VYGMYLGALSIAYRCVSPGAGCLGFGGGGKREKVFLWSL